jgi:nitrogen fixation protein FixH
MPASRRREPWPVALAAGLCFMIGASLGFWRLASAHPDALVVDDAYAAGRAFSERVRAARRTEALGWRIALDATPGGGGAAVRVRVTDSSERPVAAERVTLRRERPAEGGLDADLALTAGPDGWRGEIGLPRPGRWLLVVRAELAGEAVERSFALFAP